MPRNDQLANIRILELGGLGTRWSWDVGFSRNIRNLFLSVYSIPQHTAIESQIDYFFCRRCRSSTGLGVSYSLGGPYLAEPILHGHSYLPIPVGWRQLGVNQAMTYNPIPLILDTQTLVSSSVYSFLGSHGGIQYLGDGIIWIISNNIWFMVGIWLYTIIMYDIHIHIHIHIYIYILFLSFFLVYWIIYLLIFSIYLCALCVYVNVYCRL